MKNMKKIAALGMSAVMVAGMMAGCGSNSDSSSSDSKGSSKSGDKVELTLGIWDENQRDAMQKMIDAYEAENDNVSRNAVHGQLKNVEERLQFYEKSLHLYENRGKVLNLLSQISEKEIAKEIEQYI
mgnify:CR=1 FL=1